jgi:hypothetical protein
VVFALAVGVVLAASFLRGANTSLAVATNIEHHPAARGIAETGLALAVRHVKADADWRDGKTSGQWLNAVAWQGGSFRVRYTDDDGDLADNHQDVVHIEAIGTSSGVSHRVEAAVLPTPGAPLKLLFCVKKDPVVTYDERRISLFEAWGYEVTVIPQNASAAEYAAAMAEHDVFYSSSSTLSSRVQNKLGNPPIGIVLEEGYLHDAVGLSSGNARSYAADSVYFADNLHPITRGFSLGHVRLTDERGGFRRNQTDIADDARLLATETATGVTLAPGDQPDVSADATPTLLLLEAGDADIDGHTVHGRRVGLPISEDNLDPELLTAEGAVLLRRAIEWAAGGTPPRGHVAAWGFDETQGVAVYDGIDDHHALLVGATNDRVGRIGRAADFDGTDDHALVQSRPQLNPTDAMSLTLWVNADAWTDGDRLVSKADHGQYRLWIDSGSLRFDLDGVGTVATSAPGVNVWHHVAATYDGDELRLYLDGQLKATASASGSITQTDAPLCLGGTGPTGSAGTHFDGSLDDVRLFSRGLSHREAQWLYDHASADGLPQLVADYRFDTPPADATPQLVARWAFDDAGSGGGLPGGVAMGGKLTMYNQAAIDAYDESLGAYDPARRIDTAVVTNRTGSSTVVMSSQATIHGDLLIGPGGDVANDITQWNQATATGTTAAAANATDLPEGSVPDDMPNASSGNTNYNGGNHTWSGDYKFSNLNFYNNARVTVVGDVRVHCTAALTLSAGHIDVPDGSSLTLYVKNNVALHNNSTINADTAAPDRVTLYVYGTNKDLTLNSQTAIAGTVIVDDDITLNNNAAIHGRVVAGGDLTMNSQSAIHVARGLATVVGGGGGGEPDAATDDATLATGTPDGVTSDADGRIDGAFVFDGAGAFVAAPHHPAHLLDRGAVTLWFKPDATAGTQALVVKDDATTRGAGGHFRLALSGSTLSATIDTIDATTTVSGGGVVADQWQHAAVSFGPGGLRLYLDGTLIGSSAWAGGLGPSSGGRGNELPWVFGASPTATIDPADDWDAALAAVRVGQAHAFAGRLDDARLYNRPLDAAGVARVMADATPAAADEAVRLVDSANTDRPAHLPLADPALVEWLEGQRLRVVSGTAARSPSAVPKVHQRLTDADAFTLVATFAPADDTQAGPATIVSAATSSAVRNLTLGQDATALHARVRVGNATAGDPALVAPASLQTHGHERVLLIYDGDQLALYRNGNLETSITHPGTLDGFDPDSPLTLLNEAGDGRPWRGVLESVALYDAAFDASQRQRAFRDQAPGPPGSGVGEGSVFVTWVENP